MRNVALDPTLNPMRVLVDILRIQERALEVVIIFEKTQVPEDTIEAPEEVLVLKYKDISIFNKRDVEYKIKGHQ